MQRLTSNIIPPQGPLDSKICFISGFSGDDDDVGGLFNRCLAQKKIIRSQTLIRGVFSQRPPGNNLDYFFQDKKRTRLTWEGEEHVQMLKAWLEKRLEERKVNVLVALGATPMQILTGKKRINKWRGSVLACTLVEGFKVYSTYHPTYINKLMNETREALYGEKKKQQQNVLPLFLVDLDRVQIQAERPDFQLPQRKFDTDLSFEELCARLDEMGTGVFPEVAMDIETKPGGAGPIVWCVGFASSPDYAFVVPILRRNTFAWSLNEEAILWRKMSEIFLNSKILKIAQGGSYDLTVLGRYYGIRCANGSYGDTMLCHHANYPYLRKALEVLTSMYTWEPYYKDEGKVNLGRRTDEAEFSYNAKDCCTEREIYPITCRDSRELGTWSGYQRTMSVFPAHLGMMIRGVRIDTKKKLELGDRFTDLSNELQHKVNKAAGGSYNLNASAQKQRLLYGYLGLPFQYHPKTKKVTTDKDALQRLKKQHPKEEILGWVLDYQKYAKLASTYTSMNADADGRVRTNYGWVSTWRLSSSKSHFSGPNKEDAEGGNLQNIPVKGEEGKLIRALFLPDEGKEMGKADYSQIEARIIAYEAGDIQAIKMYEEGYDVHWFRACRLFKIPLTVKYLPNAKFKDHLTMEDHTLYEFRQIGKTVNYAGYYGMGPRMLQTILAREGFHIDFTLCKKLLSQQKAADLLVDEWQRRIREKVRATRTLISSFGRVRQFMGRFSDELYRAAYAFSPQNTAGEMLQVATQKVWEEIPFVDPLLTVHDELVFQYDPQRREEAHREVKRCMSLAVEIKGRTLVVPTDHSYGQNWGEMEEIGI
uniref:Putative DNA polymerase n=1 Tax=viral metagenome TaxID=1070528 RepID=A0A6M3L018_9ZZZZ